MRTPTLFFVDERSLRARFDQFSEMKDGILFCRTLIDYCGEVVQDERLDGKSVVFTLALPRASDVVTDAQKLIGEAESYKRLDKGEKLRVGQHNFYPSRTEGSMICWRCGAIIKRCESAEQAKNQLREIGWYTTVCKHKRTCIK